MPLLRNATQNRVIASGVQRANGEAARVVGFLSKKTVGEEEGIWFPRCAMLHTFGMRTPIDIIFLDDLCRVLKTFAHAKPWRAYRGGSNCAHALELAPGKIERSGVAVGDQLVLEQQE